MSIEKAIRYGKDHRKPYYDSRNFDWSCRNHHSCPFCENTRLFDQRKKELYAKYCHITLYIKK